MSEAELIFTALAQLSTRQISESVEAKGLGENSLAGKRGGRISRKARIDLENETGRKVISSGNFLAKAKNRKTLKAKE